MAQNLSNDHINLTMLTDFYEITMANGYFTNGFKDTIGYFDMFFRKVPDGGVYKLAAVEKPDGTIVPKIKISENVAKITTPCFKEVWRIFDRETDKAIADVITLNDEVIDDEKPYTIFDPNHTWKRKTVENFRAVRLRTQLFKNGECLYQPRALSAIRAHCLAQVDTLWEEVTRFENPHSYYVDLSQKLWDEKNRLLSENQY